MRKRIDDETNNTTRQILLACWFFILEECSNRKKDGNGLATRPAPVDDVISHYKSMMREIITDYRNAPFGAGTRSRIITGSAKNFANYSYQFELETGKKLGAIIFSPPYVNSLYNLFRFPRALQSVSRSHK